MLEASSNSLRAKRDHSKLHKGTAPFDLALGRPAINGQGGVNMYGMAETCTAFSCTQASDEPKIRATCEGKLLPGCELKIVSPDTGEILPAGEQGEMCVKGPAVMRRYYRIDPETIFDEQGFFRTGDLGSIDEDGYVHFSQRLKEMIKTGGINVSPADIEGKLQTLPGLEASYAFPIESPEKGEVVGAALVPSTGQELRDADILEHFEKNLPGYKRPSAVLVIPAEKVPMTGSGKVQKVNLRAFLLERLGKEGTGIVRF
jgi:fatty-acyl-CoA synthase